MQTANRSGTRHRLRDALACGLLLSTCPLAGCQGPEAYAELARAAPLVVDRLAAPTSAAPRSVDDARPPEATSPPSTPHAPAQVSVAAAAPVRSEPGAGSSVGDAAPHGPPTPEVARDALEGRETHEEPREACQEVLWITELLVNPKATPDELGEYVELHNPGPEAVDLRGWTLSNNRRQKVTFGGEDALWIPPGEVALVAASLDPDENGELTPLALLGRFTLPNQGGVVRLTNPCGDTVERLRYTAKQPWNAAKPGVALERRRPGSDPDDPKSWKRARARWVTGDLGTPGRWP